MNEAEIKREMRLWSIEVLVANLLAMLCELDPTPVDLFVKIRDQMIEGARKQAFPDLDPAESDVLSGELEAAVSRLVEMAGTKILHGRGIRDK
jgi:hypothetical protein